ncbi:single-strand DNA-binding protein [Microbacterium phyllosphaerae]|uniref:Single-stranded DNA-binding protein n=1 Tax=Microbacterium phyllosphaerae TaxID=124798 RepID=A0ABS4WR33_9MICO|nr:single-stranded DNA-binding protein [Microbacterium phyllosphaerae]MBP2378665.1 single-strand DNA-binding protein [Microbacterium phyllosphaerae]
MHDTVTIVGNVATDPTLGRTASGIPVTNFRLASTHRRFDDATQTWIDVATNWYSVAAFRQLAEHAKVSLRSGDSVIVTGRMKIRAWENNGKQGTSVDIDADVIGHDLRWGTTAYRRSARSTPDQKERGRVEDGDDAPPASSRREPADVDTSWADRDAVPGPDRELVDQSSPSARLTF